jgi:hypothetical protein
MIKIKNFFKSLDFGLILAFITELFLLILILSNLYLINKAETPFEAKKYIVSTILAIIISAGLEIAKRYKK